MKKQIFYYEHKYNGILQWCRISETKKGYHVESFDNTSYNKDLDVYLFNIPGLPEKSLESVNNFVQEIVQSYQWAIYRITKYNDFEIVKTDLQYC